MRAKHLLLLGLAATAALGCGDGGSGPSEPVNVTGEWAFEAHDMTAPGATGKCGMTGTLWLEQDGTTVTGSYQIDRITCTGPGGGTYEGPISGPIVSGTVEGTGVHFHFDTEDLDQHGTVAGNRMTGTCNWRGEINGYVTLSGKWSATRT